MKPVALTPSCERILNRFAASCTDAVSTELSVRHLLTALLLEESLGGQCLRQLRCDANDASRRLFEELETLSATFPHPTTDDAGVRNVSSLPEHVEMWFRPVFERGRRIAVRSEESGELSSELLVLAMAEVSGPAQEQLRLAGICADSVRRQLDSTEEKTAPPMPVDLVLFENETAEQTDVPQSTFTTRESETPAETGGVLTSPGSRSFERSGRTLGLLDANLNRAREGLRVLEDAARFILRDRDSTAAAKQLRHDLVTSEVQLRRRCANLLHQRDTEADVGTDISTRQESARATLADILTANARRVQEALRSLEEFGKLVDPKFAEAMKQLRYRSYTVEQSLLSQTAADRGQHVDSLLISEPQTQLSLQQRRLQRSVICVLLTESLCRHPWQFVAEQAALAGGADVMQLREKHLPDRELSRRAEWLSDLCRQTGALCILNDRADLAADVGVDGVHIGQDDTPIAEARTLLRPEQLLGVSTHSADQLQAACHNNADYLGVGPVFPSQTKTFADFPGLAYVKQAVRLSDRPFFAIGGIRSDNISQVRQTGCRRVAVCGDVLSAESPADVIRLLKGKLNPD